MILVNGVFDMADTAFKSKKGYWDKSHYISQGATGFWTKYGGARNTIMQEELEAIWYCQSCSKEQPSDLKPYKKEILLGEYIRVCAVCINDDTTALIVRINKIEKL